MGFRTKIEDLMRVSICLSGRIHFISLKFSLAWQIVFNGQVNTCLPLRMRGLSIHFGFHFFPRNNFLARNSKFSSKPNIDKRI